MFQLALIRQRPRTSVAACADRAPTCSEEGVQRPLSVGCWTAWLLLLAGGLQETPPESPVCMTCSVTSAALSLCLHQRGFWAIPPHSPSHKSQKAPKGFKRVHFFCPQLEARILRAVLEKVLAVAP